MKLQIIALEMQSNPLPHSYTDLTANFKTEKKIFALSTYFNTLISILIFKHHWFYSSVETHVKGMYQSSWGGYMYHFLSAPNVRIWVRLHCVIYTVGLFCSGMSPNSSQFTLLPPWSLIVLTCLIVTSCLHQYLNLLPFCASLSFMSSLLFFVFKLAFLTYPLLLACLLVWTYLPDVFIFMTLIKITLVILCLSKMKQLITDCNFLI